jgi:hypothetical protein
VHVLAAIKEYIPAAQPAHAELTLEDVYIPAEHPVQKVADELEYMPTLQAKHKVADVLGWYIPETQTEH